jgi:hypothetical protein
MNNIHEISSQGGGNDSLLDTSDGDISNNDINIMDDDNVAFEVQSAASSDHVLFLLTLSCHLKIRS